MKNQSFLWGAATSAHQVEGNNVHNDWWQWEKDSPQQTVSGKACDHYERFREDFALAASLGHTAHRLSLEWSRFEPTEGAWSAKTVAHYREVLTELKRHNLVSFVTLHHFTNPLWLARRGGWEHPRAVYYFERYAERVARDLGDLIDVWVTVNEPMVYASHAYWNRKWPPQLHSVTRLHRVIGRLAEAHNAAYQVIHRHQPNARVGIAQSVIAFMPAHPERVSDRLLVEGHEWWYNHRFFSLTTGTHDYIGLNYYFSVKLAWEWARFRWKDVPLNVPRTDVGWPVYPAGLEQLLLDFRRYKKPLYILENGIADAADTKRADYIREHIRAVERAQAQGADVRGYFYWSLLDNFEWAAGFGPRFGLVEVNYDTQERRPRRSAYVYKAIIEQAKTYR